MIDAMKGLRFAALTLMVAAPTVPVAAMPPPVGVTPLVRTADAASVLQSEMTALVHELGLAGFFAAEPAPPSGYEVRCRVDEPERERCFAEAARDAPVAHAVFVLAEPARDGVRVTCIGPDGARSQQAELSIEAATGDDAQAALRERSVLSRCIIGALHAPPRA